MLLRIGKHRCVERNTCYNVGPKSEISIFCQSPRPLVLISDHAWENRPLCYNSNITYHQSNRRIGGLGAGAGDQGEERQVRRRVGGHCHVCRQAKSREKRDGRGC